MSHEYNARYELERKRREELKRKRAAEFSEKAYKEIFARYEQMKNAEYDSFVPSEMGELSQNIKNIEQLLQTDIFEARRLCYQAQDSLSSMDFLVRAAKEEFTRQERLRYEEIQRKKAEAKSKLEQAFYTQLGEIKDPAVANFAIQDLESIKSKIQSEAISSKEELAQQLKIVCGQANEKARKWKEERLAKEKIAILSTQIDSAIKATESEKFENDDNKNKLVNKMKTLKDSLTAESSESEIAEKINIMRSSVDDSLIDEEVRRETVKAIVKELKSQEFTVEKPQIFGTGKDSYVLIKAKKPSGKQATCKISLEGKLNYRFDKYEGMTCLKDIEKFNVDLEKIYSVKFSDERVIWENPDKLSRTQESSSDTQRRNM
ncbi:MAG: hypothetical protein K6G18_00840 [Treponema sp.]|nr:hypothetical protein [Treponema sp.]